MAIKHTTTFVVCYLITTTAKLAFDLAFYRCDFLMLKLFLPSLSKHTPPFEKLDTNGNLKPHKAELMVILKFGREWLKLSKYKPVTAIINTLTTSVI